MGNLDYGVIGNCNVSALVSKNADIVWYCLPRFDGDPVFCSLLNDYENQEDPQGIFSVKLTDFSHSHQFYQPNTAVLVTQLFDDHGNAVEVCDFCPRFKQFGRTFRPTTIIRMIKPLKGYPRITIKLRPLSDYGANPCSHTMGSNHIRYIGSHQVMRLTTNAALTHVLEERSFVLDREFTMILGPDESLLESVREVGRRFLYETQSYWRMWVRYLAIPFEWQDQVIRAAITLKLSAYEDTGAIIAAPTTSLPESLGSERNWDYRYCWLRDSYFVVNALNRLGATQTMEHFLEYIMNLATNIDGQELLQPVYCINGQAKIEEYELPHLAGFKGAKPVRVGNQAYQQIQHDVYGAVVLALAQTFFDRRISRPGNEFLFKQLEHIGELAVRTFAQPDAGLWELRGSQHVHTFSSVMCWAACDRIARIAEHLQLPKRARYWFDHTERMRSILLKEAWHEGRQALSATFGGDSMDASLLLIKELGLLRGDDHRFLGTVKCIEEDLKRGDFIFRYITEDDFGVPDNAFTVCTFWYIDALAAVGRKEEARALFEKLLASTNHLGLMAEHVATKDNDMWGNFPQTYSMVGIINSAMKLSKPWEEAF